MISEERFPIGSRFSAGRFSIGVFQEGFLDEEFRGHKFPSGFSYQGFPLGVSIGVSGGRFQGTS